MFAVLTSSDIFREAGSLISLVFHHTHSVTPVLILFLFDPCDNSVCFWMRREEVTKEREVGR